MQEKVITIVGPTAVGKTNLSIELAKNFNGEIISGDSMQVYKGLDIGTAKVTPEEMQGISHYMLNIKEAHEEFSVAQFQQCIQKYIKVISSKQKLPLVVGGSGLYVQAALYDYQFTNQKRDQLMTNKLEAIVHEQGITPLFDRLKQIDPEQAKKIHPNNHRRVIRALEIYETTGKTMTQHHQEQTKESPYDLFLIGLQMDRKLLYDRIDKRVDHMIEQGLIEEVSDLYGKGYQHCQSMKAIGYKEFIPYFEGKQTRMKTIELLKRNSRRYAKRQFTWFKNKLPVTWYTLTENNLNEQYENIMLDVAGFLNKK